ncbi:MAG TPA: glycosyltransferase family 4 protein [Bryobacteraceae bacterium]|jgi:glycosyltransferase involved in cell wall biosynthesis|nr:glycosyltransferase family 4 protein [Bryobacteraceae bacterium]
MESVSILLVTNSYLPIMGGSEIEAQRVSQALIRRGHRVQILCPGGPPMPAVSRWTDDCGIPVRIFGNRAPARIRGHVFAWRVVWALLSEARTYDLVYFLMPGLQVALGSLMARLLGKPFIMKFSGSNEVRRMKNSTVGRLQLRVLDKWAGSIMVLNPGMMLEAAECGLQRSKLLWMPNPVDLDEFRPPAPGERAALRAKFGIPAEADVVLFVGRLAPEKELPSLVKGFEKIAAQHERAMLVLVGDGPCRGELETLAGKLIQQGKIRFTGAVASSAVHQWVQIADVFSLVSSLEGLPVSLIEAMAAGLPAVVSDIPANRQLIDPGIQGLVVEPKNAEAIGSALSAVLENPELRRSLGDAARARIGDNFSTARVTLLYETLFARLLN